MVNKEIKIVVDAVSNEKDIDKEIVYLALEEAMAAATQKSINDFDARIEVSIDRKTGEVTALRRYDVVSEQELLSESNHLSVQEAIEKGFDNPQEGTTS